MKFIYCPDCGNKLVLKEIGDEGLVPFCQNCSRPFFDINYTCIITAAINEYKELALIKQAYVNTENYILVAGYIKSGENAEETVLREVSEELGLSCLSVSYIKSYYYKKREMLMLGFETRVKKADFNISGEVDEAKWFPLNKGLKMLRYESIAYTLLKDIINKEQNDERN